MKNSVFIVLSLALAGLFAWQYVETGKLQKRVIELEARASAPPPVVAKEEAKSARVDNSTSADPAVAESDSPESKKDANPMNKISKAFEAMMKSDGGKEAMKMGSKGMLEGMFKDLFELMDLDPETKKAFLAAMSDDQIQQQTMGMKFITAGTMSKEEKAALIKEFQDNHLATEEKLKGILGTEEKFSQYKQFQDSAPERQQLTGLKEKFSAAGAPMDDALEQSVMDVMYSERKNMKWDYDYTDQQDVRPEKFTDESIARFEAQNKEYDQRMESRLNGTLNESQMEAFRKQRTEQNAMASMGLKFAQVLILGDGK